jgi:hypothetical protein
MHILLVGTGSIGRRHAANLRSLVPDVQFSLFREGGREDDFSRQIGAQIGVTLEACLARRPDAVVVANPPTFHLRAMLDILSAGVPFYLEKPVVTDQTSWLALNRCIERLSVLPPNIVGCNLRFLRSLELFRDIVTSGSLGKCVRATFQAGQWLPDWRPDRDYRHTYSAHKKLGGGVLCDLVHEIDAVRWILGEFDAAHCVAGQFSSLEINSDDVAAAILCRPGGPLVQIGLDYVSRRPVREYRVVGEEGTAVWDLARRELRLETQSAELVVTNDAMHFDVAGTYLQAMREFLNAVRLGTVTRYPLSEAMKSTALMLKLKEEALL